MIKKTLIVGLILCSFLVLSASTVIAADKTLIDEIGDVTDYYGELVTTSQNINVADIDIVEVTYSKQGQTITLTIKVRGQIENRGSVDELYAEDNINVVLYVLSFDTSKESYYIFYVNDTCQIVNETENITVSDFEIIDGGKTLKVTFDALHDDETYEYMYAYAEYTKIANLSGIDLEDPDLDYEELYEDLIDEAQDILVIIDGPSDGEVEEDIDFTSTISGGSTPYTYAWDFGDGEASDDENDTTHTYDTAGTYTVILTVTDDYNNQDSDSFTITISDNEANNGGGTEENSAILLFAAVIAIIVIIGVIVIVLIIRR